MLSIEGESIRGVRVGARTLALNTPERVLLVDEEANGVDISEGVGACVAVGNRELVAIGV